MTPSSDRPPFNVATHRTIEVDVSLNAHSIDDAQAFIAELTRALSATALQKARQGRHGVVVTFVATHDNARKLP
jgi:hypothetical protein